MSNSFPKDKPLPLSYLRKNKVNTLLKVDGRGEGGRVAVRSECVSMD